MVGTSGAHAVTWWIDASKDFSPTRIRRERGGKLASEMRCDLRDWDGTWFPETTEYYSGRDHGAEPYLTIRVFSAAFNQPELPDRLLPPDIGIEVGTNIGRHGPNREPLAYVYWDGEKIVSHEEYLERLGSGELKQGPSFLREAARLLAQDAARDSAEEHASSRPAHDAKAATRPAGPLALGDRTKTEWEQFTQEFIDRCALGDEQSQRAWAICRDCQYAADAQIASRRADCDKLSQQEEQLRLKLGAATNAERKAVEDARSALRRPLDEIFEKQLKPRLEKLPTRAQRARAGGLAASSRPGPAVASPLDACAKTSYVTWSARGAVARVSARVAELADAPG